MGGKKLSAVSMLLPAVHFHEYAGVVLTQSPRSALKHVPFGALYVNFDNVRWAQFSFSIGTAVDGYGKDFQLAIV